MKTPAKRILIVDDVRAIANRIALLIEECKSCNYEIRQANTVVEAKNLLNSETFNLILLDIHLKENNGLFLLQEIKNRNPEVYVIMITNNATVEYRNASLQLGADNFLDKTTDFEFIPQVISKLLSVNQR